MDRHDVFRAAQLESYRVVTRRQTGIWLLLSTKRYGRFSTVLLEGQVPVVGMT
jgi:hypothetical protein